MKQLNQSNQKSTPPIPINLIPILLLFLLINFTSPQDFIIKIAPGSSQQINQVSDYQILTGSNNVVGYFIPTNSILLITFPPQYNTTILHNKSYTGFSLSNADSCYFDNDCIGVTVTYRGNSFAINGLFTGDIQTTDSWSLAYTIYSIQNPNKLSVGSFAVTIYLGTTIYYPSSGSTSSTSWGSSLTFQPVNYVAQVLYPTIWAISPLKLTITPNNVIDTIRIKFPSAWNGQIATNTAALTANPIFTSVSNPSITASNLIAYYSIVNLYYYTAGQPIDITISSIFNPSALRPAGTIILYLVSSNSILEQSSFSLPSSSFSNDILRNLASTLTYQANDKIQVQLNFQFAQSNYNTDKIYITFPSQLVILTTTSSYTITMGTAIITPTITFDTITNTISFNINLSGGRMAGIVVVTGIVRPRQCKSTSNFSIKTYRLNLFLMDSSTCCSLQLSNRQTLVINSITLSNSQHLQASVTYTFSFTTSVVNLITTDIIQITFPPEYWDSIKSANNASLCGSLTVVGVNFNSNIQTPASAIGCSIYMNQLTISSFLTISEPGSQTFIITLSGVTNPGFSPTTGFTISTLSSSNFILQQSQGYSITILPNTLTTFSVTPSSYQTCASNTKYTFTLGNNSPLNNGFTININFPTDYTYINYNTIQCQINSITYPCTRANSTYHTNNIIVIVKVNTVINIITSLTISSVTNPISQATTGNFSAVIYDQAGSPVQSSNGAYTIAMTSSGTFPLFISSISNYSSGSSIMQSSLQLINSNSNSLWITMVLPFSLVTPASMLITISNANIIQYASLISTCKSVQILSLCTLSINAGTNKIEITYLNLTFASLSINFLQIQITSLFISDYQNIQISATYSINGFQSLSLATPSTISKLYAQPITNYGVTFTNQILGQSSTANLTIVLSALALSQLNNIVVYVPQEFTIASKVINYASTSFVSNQLVIPGLTNPMTQYYTPFLFAVYNANGNIIAFSSPTDNTKTYSFSLGCTLPCRNCSLGVCVDCYTTISWISQIYLKNSTKTCVSQCSTGQYLSNGVCYTCDPNCQTCLMYGASFSNGNSTYCLSCPTSNYLYGTTCVQTCPSGYYLSATVCEPCMSNCLNCTSSSTCTLCKTGLSLYNNTQCIITCPASTVSYTNANTSQSSCLSCPSDCLSCSSLVTPVCLSCSSGYYLYNGACYTSCSSLSLYISYQMTCSNCDPHCSICVGYAFNCSACINPYNLYNSQCILTCPSGYYSSSDICQNCPTNCLICTSSSYCSLCQIPNALYITNTTVATCSLTCPNATIATIDSINLAYVCESCGGNCLTCQISITFCTSCQTGFILNNNTCSSTCPTGLWPFSGLCKSCTPQCQICKSTDPYNCTLCSPNYFYYNFSCNSTCPAGTYPNIVALTCSACNIACKTCVNSTNCTSCVNTSFYYQYFCYSSCTLINSSFFTFNGSCMACQSQCNGCLSTPFECVICASSLYYYNPADKSCGFSCTQPYYINGSQCSLCISQCTTCDTLYNTCGSCSGNLSLWMGQCISSCPSGFYTLNNVCSQCASECLTCSSTACLTCQAYAYRYYQTCVLNCQTTDLPITIGSYCTSCAQVPYCQSCQPGISNNFVCFVCIYPFVIFDGSCLNQCPNYYTVDATNTCVQSLSYSLYKDQLYKQNYPYFPPFCFIGILLLIGGILYLVNNKIYKYTYHHGYLISLSAVIQLIFLSYGCRYIIDLYTGDYTNQNKYIPIYILVASYGFRVIIATIFVIFVIGKYYLNDIRFREWKEQHQRGFKYAIVLTLIFGSRFFKLYYSKLFGKSIFSYRIISVQKFYYQDIITWISIVGDIVDIAAFANINYNIFIAYSVLYLLSFELFVFKGIQWLLLARDLKKPDRGFFLGDEQEAQRMIQQQNQAKQKQKRKFQMESLVKLIRRKSAGNLHYQKLYQHLFFDDFRSVYDPSDYEDVPKVPNRKIQKNINKGKFRRGKRITIQQKLKRFAQSIKPSPPVPQDNGYLRGLIYWKPPKQVKIQKKNPTATMQSQQSMMKLLQDKQLLYQDISSIHIIDLDDDNGTQHDDLQSRYRKRKRTGFGNDGDQTVINQLVYDPTSIEYIEPGQQEQYDLNGLWNKNYARKQHLPKHIISQNRYDQNDLRVLYHEPLKKRKSKLNQIRSRYY